MPSREVVEAFAKRLEDGDFVGAIEQFYAPDAATYENNAAPTVGREKLVAEERGVLAATKEVKAVRIGPSLIEGDHVATRWVFSFTNAEGVTRTLDEIAWQSWRGNVIIEERFYYDPKQLGR
ncbi:polyketide cyclase [Bradyrhizobium sp. UNPF46]|uniref:nuclear transport factor 2 family protein n=1 Tax=Bradyrhizobium sp. UNPF46 TaxID=1141168 RepID=UPI00114FBB7A|nr:nuclear transport factor 2 family protein [Bradyrhizobium sp. UNPF46]TQF37008.1 polyketide cyclase [Bradyrhizobium sp. UNPF46]